MRTRRQELMAEVRWQHVVILMLGVTLMCIAVACKTATKKDSTEKPLPPGDARNSSEIVRQSMDYGVFYREASTAFIMNFQACKKMDSPYANYPRWSCWFPGERPVWISFLANSQCILQDMTEAIGEGGGVTHYNLKCGKATNLVNRVLGEKKGQINEDDNPMDSPGGPDSNGVYNHGMRRK